VDRREAWVNVERSRPKTSSSSPARSGYEELARGLTSLDPREIVERGLELLRLVSGVERSLLVGGGSDPGLESLLTPLDDPTLQVSRSAIAEALCEGRTVSNFVAPDVGEFPRRSMRLLGLHRIWVHPVIGAEGRPVAAVYIDSPTAGDPFTPEVEARLVSVAEHIGLALRNASLYARVLDLNQNLEQKVAARTRELEASQAQLVARDRLATLGRLVAAIAHELNNPVGAIASFARTLGELVTPVLSMRDELAVLFPEPADRAHAQALLDASLEAAVGLSRDSRARRALEQAHAQRLSASGITSASALAARFSRIGLTPERLESALPLLKTRGEQLSRLAEQIYTFGRSLETIGQSASNVARIVDGLKTYSHLDRSEAEIADIQRGLQATLTVLAPRVPKGVEVVTRFAEIGSFLHRPGELTQVWTNLVDNALLAMGEQGTLTVETADAGESVRVSVSDTGCGVPETLRERIFDLDVTSRGPGAGLGLGLPICRTIVEKNHGGRISFESRPGHTTFTVLLPKSGAAAMER